MPYFNNPTKNGHFNVPPKLRVDILMRSKDVLKSRIQNSSRRHFGFHRKLYCASAMIENDVPCLPVQKFGSDSFSGSWDIGLSFYLLSDSFAILGVLNGEQYQRNLQKAHPCPETHHKIDLTS